MNLNIGTGQGYDVAVNWISGSQAVACRTQRSSCGCKKRTEGSSKSLTSTGLKGVTSRKPVNLSLLHFQLQSDLQGRLRVTWNDINRYTLLIFANILKAEQISKMFATFQFSTSYLTAFSPKPYTRINITLITDKQVFTTVRNLACHPKKKRNIA
jgi:hypothetical protein